MDTAAVEVRRARLRELGETVLSGATRQGIERELAELELPVSPLSPEAPAEPVQWAIWQTVVGLPDTQGTPSSTRPVGKPLPVPAAALLVAEHLHKERLGDALEVTTTVRAVTARGVLVRPARTIWWATWVAGDES